MFADQKEPETSTKGSSTSGAYSNQPRSYTAMNSYPIVYSHLLNNNSSSATATSTNLNNNTNTSKPSFNSGFRLGQYQSTSDIKNNYPSSTSTAGLNSSFNQNTNYLQTGTNNKPNSYTYTNIYDTNNNSYTQYLQNELKNLHFQNHQSPYQTHYPNQQPIMAPSYLNTRSKSVSFEN
jgi:hypothetical protein